MTIELTAEQEYLFDLQGFVVLENVVEPSGIDAANHQLDQLETMDPGDYPPPLQLGTEKANSEIYSSNILPLFECGPEDGFLAAIPGSHKCNFQRPWSDHPNDNPTLVLVAARPDDAIIFTEATTHGSMVNVSGRPRRTLYYCYSINWMPDGTSHHLSFSDSRKRMLNEEQKHLVAL